MSGPLKVPANMRNVTWPETHVLSFDQSLTKTGWAHVRFDSSIHIIARGTFSTTPSDSDRKGIPASLDRSDAVFHHAYSLIKVISEQTLSGYRFVALHELPASQDWVKRQGPGDEQRRGNNNTEMAFMAARAVRDAVLANGFPPADLDSRRAKKVMTGDGRSDKSLVGEAVTKLFADSLGRTNEHVRDAIANAITWMVVQGGWEEIER